MVRVEIAAPAAALESQPNKVPEKITKAPAPAHVAAGVLSEAGVAAALAVAGLATLDSLIENAMSTVWEKAEQAEQEAKRAIKKEASSKGLRKVVNQKIGNQKAQPEAPAET